MAKKTKNLKSKKKAQANKKLITAVVAISVFTLAIVGGFWFINVYRGAERNITAGDALMAEGSFKQARKMYGRAVKKEPAVLSHIDKLQEATLAITPKTLDEAKVLYGEYISTLIHEARYNSTDADVQFALLYELHNTAQKTGDLVYWRQLQNVADLALDRLPEDHPRRYEALIYRGLTHLKIDDNAMTDTIDDDGNIRFPGEVDLLEALESDPGNELAWSALAHGRMAVYYNLVTQRRNAQAEKNRLIADQTMQDARLNAGDSLEMALVYAKEVLLRRQQILEENQKKPGTFTTQEVEQAQQDATNAVDTIIATFDPSLHEAQAANVVGVLQGSGSEGKKLALGVFKQFLEEHPDNFTFRYQYAGLLFEQGRVEDAKEQATLVLDAPQQPVGVLSIQQFLLRPQAASILFQIAWVDGMEATDPIEKEANIAEAVHRRDVVKEYVSGDLTNALLLEADGDLALLEGRTREAAAKYEELISRYPFPQSTAEVYRKAGMSHQDAQSLGLAKDRFSEAIQYRPTPFHVYLKAQVEIELKEYDEAFATLSMLPDEVVENSPDILAMLENLALQSPNDENRFATPTIKAIAAFEQEISQGNTEEAIATIQAAIDATPEPDSRLYHALAMGYDAVGEKEKSIDYLDQAIALNPDSKQLAQLKILLLSEDRIEAIIAVIEESDLEENNKHSETASVLLDFSTKQAMAAARLRAMGKEEDAKKAQELSDRAKAESLEYQKLALEGDGDKEQILLVQFESALTDKEFDRAKTLLEQAKTLDVDALIVGSAEIRLLLRQAQESEPESQEQITLYQNARDGAQVLVSEFPYSSKSWKLLGQVYQVQKIQNEALAAFSKAYDLSPTDRAAVGLYLRALLRASSDSQRILRVAQDAHATFPSDNQLTEMWLNIEAQHGSKADVLHTRAARYELQPSDRHNALQYALFLVQLNPTRELILNESGTSKFTLNAWSALNTAQKQTVILKQKTAWLNLVDTILEEVKKDPDTDLNSALTHAAIERERGRLDDASEVLDQYIQRKEGSDEYTTVIIAVANFLVDSQRPQQARTMLEAALGSQSEKLEVSAALGYLLLQSGLDYERANKELAAAAKVSDNSLVYFNWIDSLIRLNRFQEAESALTEVAFKGSNIEYSKSMAQAKIHQRKGEIQFAQGEMQNARTELELYRLALAKALEADEKNPIPYLLLCKTLINEYTLTQNKELLTEAIAVSDRGSEFHQGSEDFAIVRTDVLQADGQLRRAIEELDSFLMSKPEANRIRNTLIEAHLDADDFDKAIAVATDGVSANPRSPLWHQSLGNLHMRLNDDRAAACEAYLKAISLEPSVQSVFVIDNLTRTDQELPHRDLLKMARGPLSKQHPIVQSIEAKSLQALGQQRDAEIAMKNSWNGYQNAIRNKWISDQALLPWFLNVAFIYSENPEAGETFIHERIGDDPSPLELMGIAMYWYQCEQENLDKAIAILDQVYAHPEANDDDKIGSLMRKGGFLVEKGRYEEGGIVFRKLNDEFPRSPLVLNNLAYVVGVYLNKPVEGLEIARDAAKLSPRSPSIIDTVSKLYELTGDETKAAETLDYLIQVDPANAEAMARLALLYAGGLEQPERAIVLATRARSVKPRSPEVLDALGWSYIQNGQRAKGERFLQRSLEYGETALAYLHTAQVVRDRGAYEEALGQLRLAEELASDQHTLDRISAVKDDIRKTQAAVGQQGT
ncbi:MAG: tetratricopeptide repeat protein [Phycisphaerales bacterium]|nr:tetratricopeptide repeat protein [Phycisphaerales bacterium]